MKFIRKRQIDHLGRADVERLAMLLIRAHNGLNSTIPASGMVELCRALSTLGWDSFKPGDDVPETKTGKRFAVETTQ